MQKEVVKKKFSIENSMLKLEKIVEILERGDANLDESFDYFEKAVKISKKLRHKLEEYELKIEMISKENLTEKN